MLPFLCLQTDMAVDSDTAAEDCPDGGSGHHVDSLRTRKMRDDLQLKVERAMQQMKAEQEHKEGVYRFNEISWSSLVSSPNHTQLASRHEEKRVHLCSGSSNTFCDIIPYSKRAIDTSVSRTQREL